jgi:ribonuclease P protein component
LLPKQHRISAPGEFRVTMRAGRRRSSAILVTHALATASPAPARFGFVVPKNVGIAVRRNAVQRRLRALCAEQITAGAKGVDVVVRALPASAGATFAELRTALNSQLEVTP